MPRYLITSGTSKTGAATIAALKQLGVPSDNIVAGTRNPTAQGDAIKALGAGHVVAIDYENVDSIEKALDGIDRVAVMQGSGYLAPAYKNVIEAASRKGSSVKFIVALSGGVGGEPTDAYVKDFNTAENLVLSAPGLDSVVVAPGWFFENWTQPASAGQIEKGTVYGAAADGRVAYIAVKDIGDVVAKILFDGPGLWNGQRLYITGPASFTEQEIVSHIGKALHGHASVTYSSMPPADFKNVLLGFGLPDHIAQLVSDLEKNKSLGYANKIAPNMVKLILGREPTSLAEWTAELVAARS